ncbi:patatin-like protein [Streptomyces canus]|uniref:patatin-like protein n=1 Tax=Streptomyces canus TaxID=58343 RepID=UPI00386D3F37|nr:patatin-like protein [Streptomyces canus]
MSMDEEDGDGGTGHLRSELRLAATFTGGVSLAVWMGGVAREMNLLAGAGRTAVNEPDTPDDRLVRAKYEELLRLLQLDVSIDVLSGTSAGGINAAVLGLATVRGCDIGMLRDLWLDEGSLGGLLRDPTDHNPPSLLRGDQVLLNGLRGALQQLVARAPDGARSAKEDPTRVFITTTLLKGREHIYGDDYDSPILDTNHQGMFTFDAQQLSDDAIVAPLALAARSSASFPAAFEPSFVSVNTAGGAGTDGDRPDMAPYLHVDTRTQFCADGGLLANRPLGPALQAVFDRPAGLEVRRVLAYVVPSPGLAAGSGTEPPHPDQIPAMGPALISVLNALQSQSISAEFTALEAHNERARARQRAESHLAKLARNGDLAVGGLHAEYRSVQAQSLARAAADETLRQLASDGSRAADGRPVGFGADLETLATEATKTITSVLPTELAAADDALFAQLPWFGREVLDGAKATVLRLLHGGFDLPSERHDELNELVREVYAVMPARSTVNLSAELNRALTEYKQRPSDGVFGLARSDAWRDAVRSQLLSEPERENLAAAWRALADVLVRARDILLARPSGLELTTDLTAVLHHLTDLAAAGPTDQAVSTVARRLFYLQAAKRVLYPDESAAQHVVELAQMSANTRTLLDTRSLAEKKLTGLQLYHFGAFYKRSWRANDWMWGRLDGAGWLVHVLLSPRLLARLGQNGGASFRKQLVDGLQAIAGTPPPPGVDEGFPDGRAAELDFLTKGTGPAGKLPASIPTTSLWVASGLQRLIAAKELSCVAEQAELDKAQGTAHTPELEQFLAAYARVRSPNPAGIASLRPEDAETLLNACRISEETFTREMGTKFLRSTLFRSLAVAANAVASGTRAWKPVRFLFRMLNRALRGLARTSRR